MRLVAVVGLNRGLGPISITLQGQVQPSELTLNKVGYEEKNLQQTAEMIMLISHQVLNTFKS